MEMKLELVPVPASDIDPSLTFSTEKLGFGLDVSPSPDVRVSKVDAQRAMREAGYAPNSASSPSRREGSRVGRTSHGSGRSYAEYEADSGRGSRSDRAATEAERYRHKFMNGRACTREAALCEKSHP